MSEAGPGDPGAAWSGVTPLPLPFPGAGSLRRAYDEMVTGQGRIRPHWAGFLGGLGALPEGTLPERARRALEHLEDDGVTYTAYGDNGGTSRSWALDLMPLLLPEAEWAQLAAGLAQRARLLDAVLSDLYGPQRLLAERLVPPALVHANPEFLRPARRAGPESGMVSGPGQGPALEGGAGRPAFLQFYAADLVRGPDGIWRIAGDRTQAPTGAGFALENRRVLSRTLPELYRTAGVRPLKPFFEQWQETLSALAPGSADNPRLGLLTPGEHNEAYFEHVYLSRELGLTLVEGGDLTVRDGRAFLKTLDGLKPIDVLLRRVDGDWTDPLELRAESRLGAAGLMEAERTGMLSVANRIGSGLVESPGLVPFLPALCRRLLGEELAIPDIPTEWCGESGARRRVMERLDAVTLRSAFIADSGATIGAERSEAQDRAARIADMRARPHCFVARENALPSVAPGWSAAGLSPQPVVLRMFLTATPSGYMTMPGGLARVPVDGDPFSVALQRGGASKDVWLLAAEGHDVVVAGSAAPERVEVRRSTGDLPSRVADDLYWLGRYAERLDGAARLLRAALWRLVGGWSARELAELGGIARILGTYETIDPQTAAASPDSRLLSDALAAAATPGQPLARDFQAIQRIAVGVRDWFSSDSWAVVKHLSEEVPQRLAAAGTDIDRLLSALDEAMRMSAAFSGMASENMTRGSGWRFLDIGRRLQRVVYATRTVSGAFGLGSGGEAAALRLSLELCDSSITYRRRYRAALQAEPVLDLLLADDTNPRAVAHQLAALEADLGELPQRRGGPFVQQDQRLLTDLRVVAAMYTAPAVQALAVPLDPARLIARLEDTEQRMGDLSDALTRSYFSHIPTAHALGLERRAS